MKMDQETKRALWRKINFSFTIFWITMVPISIYTGWISSIVFVSAVSIYANAISHLAAWRADD